MALCSCAQAVPGSCQSRKHACTHTHAHQAPYHKPVYPRATILKAALPNANIPKATVPKALHPKISTRSSVLMRLCICPSAPVHPFVLPSFRPPARPPARLCVHACICLPTALASVRASVSASVRPFKHASVRPRNHASIPSSIMRAAECVRCARAHVCVHPCIKLHCGSVLCKAVQQSMQQVARAAVGAVVGAAASAADAATVGAAVGTICDGSDRCNGRGIGQFTGGLNDDGGSVMIYCSETLSATTLHSPSKNMLTCLHITMH